MEKFTPGTEEQEVQKPLNQEQVNVFAIEENEKFPASKALVILIPAGMKGDKIADKVKEYEERIKKEPYVFVSKANKQRMSRRQMKSFYNACYDINKDVKIFVDQEGGKIVRFNDFTHNENMLSLHEKHEGARERYEKLSEQGKEKMSALAIGGWKKCIGGLEEIGKIIDAEKNEEDKQAMRDYITYIKMLTLRRAGVNNYGFVCDLNYGNPVAKDDGRSLGSDVKSYELYGLSLIDNAAELGIDIYLKHFPGHGAGKTDSHFGVLTYYRSALPYLEKNMELFSTLMHYGKAKDVQVGIMPGHIIMPKGADDEDTSFYDAYTKILDEASYVITDDLKMEGHSNPKDFSDLSFYGTGEALKRENNLIELDLGTFKHITE